MNCKICSRRYNIDDLKPQLIYPCCHILCTQCLIGLPECPLCSETIINKTISQDLMNIIKDNKQNKNYLEQEIEKLKQNNKLIEANCIDKKKSIQIKLNNLEQDIQSETDKILEKIQFEKSALINSVKKRYFELDSKLEDVIKQDKLIEDQLVSLRKKYQNSDSIDFEELTSIENKIKTNLQQLDNLNSNQTFIGSNNTNNLIGLVIQNEKKSMSPLKRRLSEDYDHKIKYSSSLKVNSIKSDLEKDSINLKKIVKSNLKQKCLKKHLNTVNSLVVLLDGSLASAASDDTIRIWNIESGLTIRVLCGHGHGVICLALLLNGNLASGSRDRTIRIWNTETGITLKILHGHNHWVRSLTVLVDGTLVSGSEDETIRFWDIEKENSTKIFNSHNSSVECLAVLSKYKLAAGFWDCSIRIIELLNLKEKYSQILNGHTHRVSCLMVLNDCTLASGSFDKTIRIWDLNNGCTLNVLRGHSGIVMSLALLSNGSLASSSEYIRIWDIMSGETIKVLNGHTEKVKCLIALKNGGLASGSYDRSIVIHL